MDRKEMILSTISSLVYDLLGYDREEDLDLPIGAIETAIEECEISIDEIVTKFSESLRAQLSATMD